jgi:hypothetical protein
MGSAHAAIWPKLPDAIRVGMAAMVKATSDRVERRWIHRTPTLNTWFTKPHEGCVAKEVIFHNTNSSD